MGFPSNRPETASVAPRDSAPTSPSQIRAGQILKYKNAVSEPIRNPRKEERVVSRIDRDIIKKAMREITKSPEARPSNPSEIFTAFANETITKAEKGM